MSLNPAVGYCWASYTLTGNEEPPGKDGNTPAMGMRQPIRYGWPMAALSPIGTASTSYALQPHPSGDGIAGTFRGWRMNDEP